METQMPIKKLGKTITQELAQVFERINESQIEKFITAVINANRIIFLKIFINHVLAG